LTEDKVGQNMALAFRKIKEQSLTKKKLGRGLSLFFIPIFFWRVKTPPPSDFPMENL
jgi:hypothetical protein